MRLNGGLTWKRILLPALCMAGFFLQVRESVYKFLAERTTTSMRLAIAQYILMTCH